jgi:hypothetical protein
LRTFVTLALATLVLAACGASGGGGGSNPNEDPRFAGLDQQIATWRTEIEKSNEACAAAGGKGCQDFQVACKAEREITPADQAKGVTAKLVAAMTFNSQGDTADDLKPGSAFAEFAKAGEAWTRSEATPVNLGTCAGF